MCVGVRLGVGSGCVCVHLRVCVHVRECVHVRVCVYQREEGRECQSMEV